jgi:hypothetical protein
VPAPAKAARKKRGQELDAGGRAAEDGWPDEGGTEAAGRREGARREGCGSERAGRRGGIAGEARKVQPGA